MQKEFERKAALTAAEFDALRTVLDGLAVGRTFTQENHYYDTGELTLKRSSRTLRIRKIGDSLVREYKHGRSAVGEVRVCTEDNVPVDALPPFITGKEIGEDEEERYFPLGVLTTERTEYILCSATLSLDKSSYLGVVDYEIEIETDGVLPLPSPLLTLNIDFSGGTPGKYHRFIKRLSELQNISK